MRSRPPATAACPSHRPSPTRRRRRGRLAALGLLAVGAVLAGCSSAGKQLLVADATTGQSGTPLWAVEPGDALGDSARVAQGVTQQLRVRVPTEDGLSEFNEIAWDWQRRVLLSFATSTGARVTAGEPGERPATLAASTGRVATDVLRRGVLVRTGVGCTLADRPGGGRTVGVGTCVISEDERWVVSYDRDGSAVRIRDLRKDTVRVLRGSPVVEATVLGRDARVVVARRQQGGVRVTMYDATDGSVVAGLGRFDDVRLRDSVPGSRGAVLQVRQGQRVELRYVDTDGRTTVVDSGDAIQPVTAGAVINYLVLDRRSPDGDVLKRWEPGGEPERLLSGRVGAAAIDSESIVALRERSGTVEFYREGPGGLEPSITVRTDTSQSVLASRTWVRDDAVWLTLQSAGGTSLVRIDTHGGEGEAPVRNWADLSLLSMDHDGSVLVAGQRSGGAGAGQQLLVGDADGQEVVARGTYDQVGNGLIRDGRIYATVLNGQRLEVLQLRAEGDVDEEVLYRNRALAGADWPEAGGAAETTMYNRTYLVQAASAAGQGGQGGQGGGTTSGAAPTGG